MEQFDVTKEMLEGARDYVPLAEKRTFCREAAKLCLERLELETADGEAVPPVFRVNPWRRTRCLATALCGLYLRQELEVSVDEDGVGWMVSEEEMDRVGGSHVMGQIQRFKSDAALRDKCFALLEDYRTLEAGLDAELDALLLAQNDGVARNAMATRAAMAELPAVLEALKELQGGNS